MGDIKCHGGTHVDIVAALCQPVPNITILLWDVAFCIVSIVSIKNTHDVSRVGLASVIRNTERVGLFSLDTESISMCHIQNLGGRCWQHFFDSQFYCCDPSGRQCAMEHTSSAEFNVSHPDVFF